MSDYQDFADNALTNMSAWNPKTGTNVYAPGGAQQYVTSHPEDYSGYGGAVSHVNGTAIGADTYGANTGTRNTPGGQYRTQYEQTRLNPFDTGAQDRFRNTQEDIWKNIRMVPGIRPNFGFVKGYGGIDANAGFLPTDWAQFDATRKTNQTVNPIEQKFLEMASNGNYNFPKMSDLMAQKGQTGLPNFGRGFTYKGQASPEEQALTQAFMAGQPVNMNRLSQLRAERIKQQEISTTGMIGNKYFMPALMALQGGIVGGAAGPLAGAGWGALTSGAMNRWKNPGAILAGTAGGALGGWGAGQLSQALNLGPIAGGALSGVGSSLGGNIGRNAVTGQWDPGQMFRNAGIAGLGGGIAGGLTSGMAGGEKPTPTQKIVGGQIGGGAAQLANAFIPGKPSVKPPLTQAEIDAQKKKQLALKTRMNPYK